MAQEYKLLSQNSTQELTTVVTKHLAEGWKLYGNPSSVYSELGRCAFYFQAVIRNTSSRARGAK